ncbi:HTTM domain-containing protein [Natrinema salinisoli]|uniref:HTTM domain-containing protein n=1 Tax=Natrinema salinisoli TaxID=2878535 RepID=UPI001CF03EDA|nr:HTTM domain-containing protein [Natrinema salinisoli]
MLLTDTDSSISRVQLRARVRDALARRFGIDTRALAAFRIVLGLVLLFDVFHRSRDLVTFYTDDGVLPRALLVNQYPAARYSLHTLSGEPWAQAVLFACAAIAAVALLVGYRTRTATVLSLLLLVSVQARNPHLLNGGDKLLSQLVLLAVFLPLGTRWALDALGDPDASGADSEDAEPRTRSGTDPRIVTPATAAMLGSVVVVFVSNALLKAEGDTWHSGEALHYALRQDQLTVLLGTHLVDYPLFLTLGTYIWAGLVTGAPLLIVLTGRLRTAYATAFIATVVGMALSMAVGLFPAVLIGGLLLFLPPRVWDALESVAGVAVDRVGVLERGATAFRARTSTLSRPQTLGSSLSEPTRRRTQRYWSIHLGCLLLVVALWSVGLLGVANAFEPIEEIDPEEHEWTMFAPDPPASYGWYVVEAGVVDEENRDVLQGSTLRDAPPPDAAETLPSFRWRKYMDSLSGDDDRADRFAAHMCERARTQTDAFVENVTLTYTEQPIRLEGEAETPTTKTVVERSCPAEVADHDRNAEFGPAPNHRN